MTDHLHVIIRGRVQGVGFRYSLHGEAVDYGLSGWVRNRSDGAVEAEFEGPRPTLEAMLSWCRQGPRMARVDSIDETWGSGEAKYQGFHVRY